jgi:hypothetical protein
LDLRKYSAFAAGETWMLWSCVAGDHMGAYWILCEEFNSRREGGVTWGTDEDTGAGVMREDEQPIVEIVVS